MIACRACIEPREATWQYQGAAGFPGFYCDLHAAQIKRMVDDAPISWVDLRTPAPSATPVNLFW